MRFLPAAILAVIAAALVVVVAPTGAAAHAGHAHGPQVHGGLVHGGHVHASMAAQGIPDAAVKDGATPHTMFAEMSAQMPAPADLSFDRTCADHGCCGNGHCSACGNAIAPSCAIELALSIGAVLPSRNAAVPSTLADEGPPRPPKTFA
jgi:hypothetical protein